MVKPLSAFTLLLCACAADEGASPVDPGSTTAAAASSDDGSPAGEDDNAASTTSDAADSSDADTTSSTTADASSSTEPTAASTGPTTTDAGSSSGDALGCDAVCAKAYSCGYDSCACNDSFPIECFTCWLESTCEEIADYACYDPCN